MSGTSYDNPCPNCGSDMQCYSDRKPVDITSGQCLECGFYYNTDFKQMSLKELNCERKQWNEDFEYKKGDDEYLPPLKKLPKCDFNF